ncbi:MAG: tetratricopeptide repeat protein [Pseudomonadota bacterium]
MTRSRIRLLTLPTVSLAIALCGGVATAQETQAPVHEDNPAAATDNDKKPVKLKPKPQFQLADTIDGLFGQLKRTRNERRAGRIAERIWEEWRSSDSKSVDLLAGWARSAMGSKKYSVALDLLDQLVVLRPNYAEAYNQRATLHFIMENYDKSIADIERTLALEPRHFGALAGLASIFERLDQDEKALEAWYKTLEVYPALKSAQNAVIRLEEELAGSGI